MVEDEERPGLRKNTKFRAPQMSLDVTLLIILSYINALHDILDSACVLPFWHGGSDLLGLGFA